MLRNNGFLKPNPYVEILVDGKSVRKTDTLKNTNHPRWDQELTVLVTPVSVLQFRVLDHSSFRKDTLLGEKTVPVPELLRKQRETRTENYILYMYLTKAATTASGSAGETSPDGGRATNSEMLVVIKGLVRMDTTTTPNGDRTEGSSVLVTVNGLVSGAGGVSANGDVVRMRSSRISGSGAGGLEEYESGGGGAGSSSSGAVSAYGSNHATSVGAIKRNIGVVNWGGEAAVAANGSSGGGDPKLLQRAALVQQVSAK